MSTHRAPKPNPQPRLDGTPGRRLAGPRLVAAHLALALVVSTTAALAAVPVAVDDTVQIPSNWAGLTWHFDVLTNDVHPEGVPIYVAPGWTVTPAAGVTVNHLGAGLFQLGLAPGVDPTTVSLTYSLEDWLGEASATATVTFTPSQIVLPACDPSAETLQLGTTSVGESEVGLGWSLSAVCASSAQLYRLFRGPDAASLAWVADFQPGSLEFQQRAYTDAGLTASTQYCYRLSAPLAGGGLLVSDVLCETTLAPAAPPPGNPVPGSPLLVVKQGASRIDIPEFLAGSWDPENDPICFDRFDLEPPTASPGHLIPLPSGAAVTLFGHDAVCDTWEYVYYQSVPGVTHDSIDFHIRDVPDGNTAQGTAGVVIVPSPPEPVLLVTCDAATHDCTFYVNQSRDGHGQFLCTSTSCPAGSVELDPGDGSGPVFDLPSVTHTYPEEGIYTATLRVTDPSSGISAEAARGVAVGDLLDAVVDVSCGPDRLCTFDGSESTYPFSEPCVEPPSVRYGLYHEGSPSWNSGLIGNGSSLVGSYTMPFDSTTYRVIFGVEAICSSSPACAGSCPWTSGFSGVTYEASFAATELPPVASFRATCDQQDPPTCVFDATPSYDDHGIASWSWDFGDGGPLAAGEVLSHTFPARGLYDVTLTVTDNSAAGQSDTATQQVDAFHDHPPVAGLLAMRTGAAGPWGPFIDPPDTLFTLRFWPSYDRNGGDTLTWTYGVDHCGGGAYLLPVQTPSDEELVGLLDPGCYRVWVQAHDPAGQVSGIAGHDVWVLSSNNEAPQAAFRVSCSEQAGGLWDCTYDASESYDAEDWESGTPLGFTWDLAGATGEPSPGGALESETLPAGEHLVSLTVTDSSGAEGSYSRHVRLGQPGDPPPVPAAAAVPCGSPPCPLLAAATVDELGVDGFSWTVTDSAGTAVQSAVGETLDPSALPAGDYTVTLTATDLSGQAASEAMPLTVDRAPQPAADTVSCGPQGTTIPVLANDSDPEGQALTIVDVLPPHRGTATVQPPANETEPATVLYQPPAGFTGEDRFLYLVTDGRSIRSAEAVITVHTEG